MASIITIRGILSSTVQGLLFNKVRDITVDKLKDGDITDAKLREIVVRELNDMTSSTNLMLFREKDLHLCSMFKHRNRIGCKMTWEHTSKLFTLYTPSI